MTSCLTLLSNQADSLVQGSRCESNFTQQLKKTRVYRALNAKHFYIYNNYYFITVITCNNCDIKE